MKGAFICPYCKTENACSCQTCAPHIKEGEYISKSTDDGENLICGKCEQVYSPYQALEEEYKQRQTL